MTAPTRSILIIDDTPEDRELYRRLLGRDAAAAYRFREAATAAEGIAACRERRPDIVLIDYLLPDDDGLAVVGELVREHGPAAFGILMLTGAGDEAIAVQALHRGAHDYLVKSAHMERQLLMAIERALATVLLHRQLEQQRADLELSHSRLQAALGEGQRRAGQLHLALETGRMTAWEIDWPGRRVIWSYDLVAPETPGAAPADHDLDAWLGRVHADDRAGVAAWLGQLVAGGAPGALIFRLIGDAGALAWIEASGARDASAAGRLFGIVQDITERKQVEAELWRRKAEFETLVENAPDIIARFDTALRHIYVSPTAARVTGVPREAFLGRTNQDLGMPAEQCAAWDEALSQVFATGEPAKIEFAFASDGRDYAFQATLVPERAQDGRIETVVSIARDVTDYRRAQDRLQFLSNASGVLAATLDYGATLQTLARLAADYFGALCAIDAADGHGDSRLAAVAAAEPAAEALFHEMRRRYPVRPASDHPVTVVLRTGVPLARSELPADYVAQHIYDADHLRLVRELDLRSFLMVPLLLRGAVVGVVSLYARGRAVAFAGDERAVLEELARRAALSLDNAHLYQEAQDALRERDAFLSVASHELRNPLTALIGRTQLLQRRLRRLPETDQVADDAVSILALGRRIDGLLHELLDVSRVRDGQFAIAEEPVDLVALWGRVVASLQSTTSMHRLLFEPAMAACVLRGDAARLEQVAYNLVNNAIKYSPDGGTVTVALGRNGDDSVQITVCDEGLGIPAADLPHVFKRFHRSAQAMDQHIPGTGIGLYVVSEIVRAHGGTIQAQSTEGAGSCFMVWLPQSPPPAAARPFDRHAAGAD